MSSVGLGPLGPLGLLGPLGPLGPPTYLALKAIDLGHVLRLMVASRHVEAGGVHQFVREQREDALQRERAPVHKVAVEEVRVRRRGLPVDREDV